MDASTIAEGIFIGIFYVILGWCALQIALGVCIGLYKGLGEFLIRLKVERLFRRGK